MCNQPLRLITTANFNMDVSFSVWCVMCSECVTDLVKLFFISDKHQPTPACAVDLPLFFFDVAFVTLRRCLLGVRSFHLQLQRKHPHILTRVVPKSISNGRREHRDNDNHKPPKCLREAHPRPCRLASQLAGLMNKCSATQKRLPETRPPKKLVGHMTTHILSPSPAITVHSSITAPRTPFQPTTLSSLLPHLS